MSIFQGNILSSNKENHVFILNIPYLQQIGIGSTTLSNYNFIITSPNTPPDHPFKEAISEDDLILVSSPINLLGVNSGEYYKFDGSKYVRQVITDQRLVELIYYHENPGPIIDQVKKKEINDIQNSLHRSVSFSKYQIPLVDAIQEIKVYFYDYGKGRNERVVTQKGPPMITATPRRSTGGLYSARNTANKQKELGLDNNPKNIGVYVQPSTEMDEDVNNTVTAPIKMTYNSNTGMWEASSQILARLITDIEPSPLIGLDIPEDQLEGTFKPIDFYDTAGSMYMGQFTTGVAIPLSVENGNPNMFGPNCIECQGTQKIEQIRVVNRSARSFKKGAVVMCSHIDGEWIVQDFGTSDITITPQPTTIGRWGFAKFIATSDWFFRTQELDRITPGDCQDMLKTKFYNSTIILNNPDLKRIAELNTPQSTIKHLNSYIQSSICDNTATTLGGNNSHTLYKEINIEAAQNGEDITISYGRMPLFWGPVFPDGYLSRGFQRIRASAKKWFSKSNFGFFGPGGNVSQLTNRFDGASHDDKFLHLPAELGSNGKYGGDGFPLEDYSKVINAINSDNFASLINTLKGNIGDWLTDEDGNDVFGLRPSNPFRVQFSSLTAELVGADDINSVNVLEKYTRYDNERNFWQVAREFIGLPNNFSGKFFGNLYSRLDNLGLGSLTTITPVTCGVYASALVGEMRTIPYDCYINYAPLNTPRAAPDPFADYSTSGSEFNGSNTVGIITARNKFSKRGGGNMSINAEQVFGLVGPAIGGAFSNPILTLLPIGGGIGWSTDTGPTMQRRYLSVWGSTINDAINSFGTTALHAMVWDAWPDHLTVFVPQYFSVMHFNEGIIGTKASTKSIKLKLSDNTTEVNITVDNIDYKDIDFRIPSVTTQTEDNQIIIDALPLASTVNKDTVIADSANWKVDTSNRGQFVTGGYYYYKRSIGLKDPTTANILSPGLGFTVGDVITSTKNTVFRITEVNDKGEIVKLEFEDKLIGDNLTYKQRGTDFLPANFAGPNGHIVTLRSPKEDGQSATLGFKEGVCYNIIEFQQGPRQRTPITRVTSSSGEGKKRVWEAKETILSIESNVGSKYVGEYEIFFFFHNDIGHVFNADMVENNPNYLQYVTISIS